MEAITTRNFNIYEFDSIYLGQIDIKDCFYNESIIQLMHKVHRSGQRRETGRSGPVRKSQTGSNSASHGYHNSELKGRISHVIS